ncbi:hypothetical protein [Fimbriiglobus ruber]|uniref:DUF1579 domain-containing protein n=1 Tax=Fimbriiglobus ruber TaxID=1908690 RepID=A0A225D9C6_9BACT|nr:hypothetical protein [Fimbriiglobus ruber]OWK37573.1 hypothetical protein FRUB_06693 [Fimbriiglobus ruber]
MIRRMLTACLLLVTLVVGARAGDAPAKTTPAQAGLEKLKALAGTWVEADKDGKPTDKVVSIIRLTAGGSTVHETIFPGQPMEMVSVYHLDGPDLVMTHYCVLGNQPRMKADPKSATNEIRFEFAGGANLDPAKDKHMHEATLKFLDADHIELVGTAWADGKACPEHCGQMKLVRKK